MDAPLLLPAREVPLGGPRAMTVRRTLPQRRLSTIGAWCFCDHYGADDVAAPQRMLVPPHPHTGLQTVTWLVRGEVRHRDSLGSDVVVRPGELNLMTAGRGVSHSEHSVSPDGAPLHGVQLWVALPGASVDGPPAFAQHRDLPTRSADGVALTVFVGALDGQVSPAQGRTPLLGAEIVLDAGTRARLPLEPAFEHGVLLLSGRATVQGSALEVGPMLHLPVGAEALAVAADGPARLLLLGGEPFTEPLLMWWNFVGRTHEDVARARADWAAVPTGGRYGTVPGGEAPLPAPALPAVRLSPRGPRPGPEAPALS